MLERIRELSGVRLGVQDYLDDFWAHFRGFAGDFWKFERCQHFVEPGVPSWEAFASGNWQEAVRLAEEQRAELVEYLRQNRHLNRRRIRVVEYPVRPYLQWEMQVLRVRVAAGDRIRVIAVEKLAEFETGAAGAGSSFPLPELIVLGDEVLYEVVYDESGALSGARRIVDADVARACRTDLESLYGQAEDFAAFFDRDIAPLPPPTV